MNKDIIERLERIETKLDAVIKALHDYDGNDEYGESSFEAFIDSKVEPCRGHDAASWDDEEEANKRMDVIGQNGNEGTHYEVDEFDDYGQRVVRDKDKDNNPAKHTGGNKKKYNNKYRRQPNTPVTPKKMGVVEHEQFRQPHKH